MAGRIYSTHDVARMVGTTAATVARWIDAHRLRAFKTAGGHRRVRDADLRAFFVDRGVAPVELLLDSLVRRVVVVEPEGRTAASLARSLRRADRSLVVVAGLDPVTALLRVGAEPPSALIVDVGAIDVVSLARALREGHSTSAVALVVLAPKPDADLERRLRAAGARALLVRPVTGEQILVAAGLAPKRSR